MMDKIPGRASILEKIFTLRNEDQFNDCAIAIFHYQYHQNPVYKRFVELLNINPSLVTSYLQIPFLPVDFFRLHRISCSEGKPERIFKSSGTTLTTRSMHYLNDPVVYERSIDLGFRTFYGDPSGYIFVTLLPDAQNAPDSSLVYMMQKLKQLSGQGTEANYPFEYSSLSGELKNLVQKRKKVMVVGITYALLDFAEMNQDTYQGIIFMETGGMKGKRPEITRKELHQVLKKSFGVEAIHSEYGMTELLSQAYSMGDGLFSTPPWMKILIRDTNDPLSFAGHNSSGGINVIDLANIDSCSFIATQDIGRKTGDNCFEISGRFDFSDLRGCNLLAV